MAEIRGAGLLIGIEVVKDRNTLERFDEHARITDQITQVAMDAGVFFYPGGTGEYRDVMCIGAPFIIDEPEIHLMEQALGAALRQSAEVIGYRRCFTAPGKSPAAGSNFRNADRP